MSTYAITGLIALAICCAPFTILSIIIYPLPITPDPKYARFVFISTSVLAVIAAYQLYTTNQSFQACTHAFHANEIELHNATQYNAVLQSKLENRPMKGVAALRAELSKCETEKSGLRWFRDDCRAHCEEHGQDVLWDIGMKVDAMFGEMREVALTGGEESGKEDGKDRKGDEVEKDEKK
ncbi:uncharacterized protein J4E84_008331 [Alternaria hordeiaustralica]|uniref:uncharacterized protein n=1 Tax=Alternaria hordeiaustralica TaxID=1187925 RepID=UPI0020C53614|nr:uncharacterized protein J4E84_008331 [Alternaria hordeiaustralica]KAI4679303.1 hypothetical protein J4E84_008331 [Alternaria hordeiaustralica]